MTGATGTDPASTFRACVIGAPRSGSGKTTVSLGIMRALTRSGRRVQPFKAGPDYLDGTWHTAAAARPSYNLDTWMIERHALRAHFHSVMDGANVAVVEGVMGLYDGFEGTVEGSTADVAMTIGAPVVLVVDCSHQSGSVAPLVYGFRHFNPHCEISGVILNNTGSARHEAYCRQALRCVDVPVLGCIPRHERMRLRDRHLGLEAAGPGDEAERIIDAIARMVEDHVDLDALLGAMGGIDGRPPDRAACAGGHPRCRIAVAHDAAFHFYYRANLDMLQHEGAELVFFSPLEDASLPGDIDGIYLGGGYPEVHAERLAANEAMRRAIRELADDGGCVYAECGGFMYLGSEVTYDGRTWPMCDVFDTRFHMPEDGRKTLGYRQVALSADCILGGKGITARGHEFHYTQCIDENGESYEAPLRAFRRDESEGVPCGRRKKRTLASYVHLHFMSQPALAANLVRACADHGRSVGER